MITQTVIITDTSGTVYDTAEDVSAAVTAAGGPNTSQINDFLIQSVDDGLLSRVPTLNETGTGITVVNEWDDDAWDEFLSAHQALSVSVDDTLSAAGWTIADSLGD
jgi:hypothetical protein